MCRKGKILKDDSPTFTYVTLRSFTTDPARFIYIGSIKKKFSNIGGRLELPKHLMYVFLSIIMHVSICIYACIFLYVCKCVYDNDSFLSKR